MSTKIMWEIIHIIIFINQHPNPSRPQKQLSLFRKTYTNSLVVHLHKFVDFSLGWISCCIKFDIMKYIWSNLAAVTDWGGANSRFLGLVSVEAARSFDQTALRPSVIKRIRQIDVKYITHITSLGVTAWTRMCEPPTLIVHWTYWILDLYKLLYIFVQFNQAPATWKLMMI